MRYIFDARKNSRKNIIHTRFHIWIYAKFREIRVFYFRASLHPVDAKNAEQKSQVRIVFERSVKKEKMREERSGSSGKFLRSPYTTSESIGFDKGLVCTFARYRSFKNFDHFSISNSLARRSTIIANNCLFEFCQLI